MWLVWSICERGFHVYRSLRTAGGFAFRLRMPVLWSGRVTITIHSLHITLEDRITMPRFKIGVNARANRVQQDDRQLGMVAAR